MSRDPLELSGNLLASIGVYKVSAQIENTLDTEDAMPTIVKYTSSKRPFNAYPKRIISPSRPQNCCAAHMVQVGQVEEDARGFPFYYRRCQVCGFTLRYFLPVLPPEPPARIQRNGHHLPKAEVA